MESNHDQNPELKGLKSTESIHRPKYFRDLEVTDMEILTDLKVNRYKIKLAQIYLEEITDFSVGPMGFTIFPQGIKPFLKRISSDYRLLVAYTFYSGANMLNLKNSRYRENLLLERLCGIPKLVADALGCDLDETSVSLKPWHYPEIIESGHPVFRKGSGIEINLRLHQDLIDELLLQNDEVQKLCQIGTIYLEKKPNGLFYFAKSDYLDTNEMLRFLRVFVGLDKRRNPAPQDFRREYLTWLNSKFSEA